MTLSYRLAPGVDVSLLAEERGYSNLGPLPGFPQHFLLQRRDHPGHQDRSLTAGLLTGPGVLWAEQQFDKVQQRNIDMAEIKRDE